MAPKQWLVLLIDDNKDFLEIFGAKLESAGFSVVRAQGGDEGLEQARKVNPDLILLDVEMPGENGFEVIQRIHKETRDKKFRTVFLTNYGEPKEEHAVIDKKYAIDIGAADYIRKSDNLDEIVNQVRGVIAI